MVLAIVNAPGMRPGSRAGVEAQVGVPLISRLVQEIPAQGPAHNKMQLWPRLRLYVKGLRNPSGLVPPPRLWSSLPATT